MLRIKDLAIKKFLKGIEIIVFTIISFVFIAPYLEKHILFLNVIRGFGYFKVVLILLSIFFITHSIIAYKYDKVVFEKYYSRQKIIYGLIVITATLIIVYNFIV